MKNFKVTFTSGEKSTDIVVSSNGKDKAIEMASKKYAAMHKKSHDGELSIKVEQVVFEKEDDLNV